MPVADLITDEFRQAVDTALEKYCENETVWRYITPASVTGQGPLGVTGTAAVICFAIKSHAELGKRIFRWETVPIDAAPADIDRYMATVLREMRASRRAQVVFKQGGSGVS